MSEHSNIEWTDDTWNPWRGCTKVSPGCANCYAEALVSTRLKGGKYVRGVPRTRAGAALWKEPFRWNKKPFCCDVCGKPHASAERPGSKYENCWHDDKASYHRRRVFSLSLGDWLDAEVPIEWLVDMLDVVRCCDQLIWILCTKRPELWMERLFAAGKHCNERDDYRGGGLADWIEGWIQRQPPKNVWLLASVENQDMADKRIPELLKIPAVVHGLSMEPLLGPVVLDEEGTYSHDGKGLVWDIFGKPAHVPHCDYRAVGKDPPNGPGLKWLIVGGESGHGARQCNVDWIRGIVRQGKSNNVPTFVKQLGANAGHMEQFGHNPLQFVRREMVHKKGGDPAEWPDDLNVRQWPTGGAK